MKSETYPLALPKDLLTEIRQTAKVTGLSQADAMRQGLKLGLPRLRAQLAVGSVKPFTAQEARRAFKKDPEWEAFESCMTDVLLAPPEP